MKKQLTKAAILAMAIAGATFITPGAAHAGWLADLLCGDDNQPALCRSHLPDWAKDATLPAHNEKAVATLKEASKLHGEAKNAFIEKNSAVLGGPTRGK